MTTTSNLANGFSAFQTGINTRIYHKGDYHSNAFFGLSSVAPGVSGMNELVKFMSDNRSDRIDNDGSVARSVYVGAEDPLLVETMPTAVTGLAAEELSYINREVLPLKITTTLTYKWNVVNFLPDMMTLNPSLGTNRGGERIESAFESHSRRVGTHFEIEDDCYRGNMGAQEVEFGMRRFAKSLADYAMWMAWGAITRPTPESRIEVKDADSNVVAFNRYLEEVKNNFAMPYKSDKGFWVGVQKYSALMRSRCQAPPTVMVMPRDKTAIITNGTDFVEHSKGGDAGVQMLLSDGFVTQLPSGLKVYEPPTFTLSQKLNNVSPTDTQVTIGSYHVAKYNGGKETDGFEAYTCMDKLYDVNTNRWETPGDLVEAMKASGRFSSVTTAGATAKTFTLDNTDADDPFLSVSGLNQSIEKWQEWIYKDCDVVFVAPLEKLFMQSEVYVAAGGESAGITTMSPPHIAHSYDGTIKSHKFNLTVNMGAHVWDYSRVIVRPNVYYNGVGGGGGVDFIHDAEAQKLNKIHYRNDSIDQPSLYVLFVKKNAKYGSAYIDLRGPAKFANDRDKPTYPCAKFYSALHGWEGIEDEIDNPNNRYPIAPICYRREFNRFGPSKKYEYHPGETHHGPIVGVGSRNVRMEGVYQSNVITSVGM